MEKLVRDKIPQIIRGSGRACEIRYVNGHEYSKLLVEKLLEEATEANEATTEKELVAELADVFAVLSTLARIYPDMYDVAITKAETHGEFLSGCVLKLEEENYV